MTPRHLQPGRLRGGSSITELLRPFHAGKEAEQEVDAPVGLASKVQFGPALCSGARLS